MQARVICEALEAQLQASSELLYRTEIQVSLLTTGRVRFIPAAIQEFSIAGAEAEETFKKFQEVREAAAFHFGLEADARIGQIAEKYDDPDRSEILALRQRVISVSEEVEKLRESSLSLLEEGVKAVQNTRANLSSRESLYYPDGTAMPTSQAPLLDATS